MVYGTTKLVFWMTKFGPCLSQPRVETTYSQFKEFNTGDIGKESDTILHFCVWIFQNRSRSQIFGPCRVGKLCQSNMIHNRKVNKRLLFDDTWSVFLTTMDLRCMHALHAHAIHAARAISRERGRGRGWNPASWLVEFDDLFICLQITREHSDAK